MATRQESESEALEQARGELLAIVGDLQAIKRRLRATADMLLSSVPSAVVVAVRSDGTAYTLEGWLADDLGCTEHGDLGGTVREELDNVIKVLVFDANFNAVRKEIRAFD
ncbi:MAG: hypothetical protein ACHQQS_06640 [Thermoanaerobaculales bacterium]